MSPNPSKRTEIGAREATVRVTVALTLTPFR
jgi:hypothetical protein